MLCVGKTVTVYTALLNWTLKRVERQSTTPQVVPYQPKPKPNPLKRKENPNKDQACHHCHVAGHWKRNCPLYLEELRANKKKSEPGAAVSGNLFAIELFNLTYKLNSWVYDTGCGIHVCNTLQGFKVERKLSYGVQYLQVGNGTQAAVEAIGMFDLVLPSGLVLKLNNCYYAPSIVRGVVSLSCLLDLGFHHTIASNGISVSLNGKKIKALRSDRGGEYLSQEFKDYLSENGIVQNLTSPYTPQQNGVSERRNRTLLDMVRSMFNLTTLPLSFWDYALESAVRILNMVPTKKVDKTPYEIWHGKAPNLSYLRSWLRGVLEFSEENLISQEFSGRDYDLEDDHMDTLPSENTSEIPVEPESLGSPSELIPVRRSERTKRAPNRLCLNMEVEDDEVGDLGEPANYKTAMLDPDKVIWQGAMDEEMKSMKVNKVWIVIDRPPNAKDSHSYSSDYDYAIWQIDIKNCLLDWSLDEDIYMEQPEGDVDPNNPTVYAKLQGCRRDAIHFGFRYIELDLVVDGLISAYIDKILKKFSMQNSKKGFIPMEVKHDLSNEMCASSDEEKAYMKKVPYASAVGSIMYAVRCTRPDVAFAQNLVSRYQQNPGKLHWVAVKHILKYLRNTKDMFLVYGGNPDTELDVTGFCDASWQCDKMYEVSDGLCLYRQWRSSRLEEQKQTTIAMHATQSEYMAASEAAMEAVWIRKFVGDLGVMPSINKPINMYCDNSAAIIFANEPGVMKAPYIFLHRYHYVREQVEEWVNQN
ncbi:retrotransposon protein, putative, ty1-copia subclass [Tanacetum coccineum]